MGANVSFFASNEFLLDIAKGKVEGHSLQYVTAFGEINSTEGIIWPLGGQLTFNDTPTTLYLSSSNNSDNQFISLVWLDANYAQQTSLVQLQGHTLVAIGLGLRINDMFTVATSPTLGDVYVANADNHSNGVPNDQAEIVATFEADGQFRPLSLYTVPAGFTAFGNVGYFSSPKGRDNDFFWNVRNPTTPIPKLRTNVCSVYQTTVQVDLSWTRAPEKTDVYFTANTAQGSGRVSTRTVVVLVDNTKL